VILLPLVFPDPILTMQECSCTECDCPDCHNSECLCLQRDGTCRNFSRSSPELTKYLSTAMDMFFTLCDDADADVRMFADEHLNKVIRNVSESHLGRVQVPMPLNFFFFLTDALDKFSLLSSTAGCKLCLWQTCCDR
jgi:hypothetical protein